MNTRVLAKHGLLILHESADESSWIGAGLVGCAGFKVFKETCILMA